MHVESVNIAREIDEEDVERMRTDIGAAMEIISDTINTHASFSRGSLLGRCVKLRNKLVELWNCSTICVAPKQGVNARSAFVCRSTFALSISFLVSPCRTDNKCYSHLILK
jgi:hypothetical protein